MPPADVVAPAEVVVGLSGGPDSVALAHILHSLGYRLLLTHCHFGLRGAEADRDLNFCQHLAAQLALPLRSVRFDTRRYAAERRLSIEMACRELRYDWWRQEFFTPGAPVAGADHYLCLCVGHHADDSAETFLMNLMRGTGIRGLVGIPPRNGFVARPLLCLSRAEIVQYLAAVGLTYLTDSTNLTTDYQRNRVRNLLLPLMEEVNPNARRGLAETMSHLREAYLLAEQGRRCVVERFVTDFSRDGVAYSSLSRAALAEAADFPAEGLVHAFLQARTPMSRALEVEMAAALVAGKKHLLFRSHEATVYLEADALVLAPASGTEGDEMPLSEHPHFGVTEVACDAALWAAVRSNRDSETAYLDAVKLHGPLRLRRWREGDRLRPLGMTSGSKLVSDLFTNAHYSPLLKSWTWVITDAADRIVWVTGLRVADDFKVDAQTRRVCRIVHQPAAPLVPHSEQL
jgi:tRNA(Ile)-lysidine synthase